VLPRLVGLPGQHPTGSAMTIPNRLPGAEPDPSMTAHLADRAVERTVTRRRAAYQRDMARIVDATFELIQRTGTVDPSMRDILAETGLSTQAFYRYFTSKDELMLALLDDGRRRLQATLERRMQRAGGPGDEVRAWIEGVLAQAANPSAAARTRPWVTSEQRLAELFPDEQRSSVNALVALLEDPIIRLRGTTGARSEDHADAEHGAAVLIYRLTFATLQAHLGAATKPSARDVDELVGFCLRGVGAPAPAGRAPARSRRP
jgi:AcrR family transcriptional regulator